jgi:hypothetical protein
MSTRRSWILVAATTVALAGILAGSVVAGRMVWADDGDRLDAAIADAPFVRVAEIDAADGKTARGVYVQATSTGHVCVSDAPLDAPLMGGGGCNPAEDPLGGGELSVSLAYDGGPRIEAVKDARVIGLASPDTVSVHILMSDGSLRIVKLKKAKVGRSEFQAFGYRFKKRDLERGVGPSAVVALDASGAEIDRQTTGIG